MMDRLEPPLPEKFVPEVAGDELSPFRSIEFLKCLLAVTAWLCAGLLVTAANEDARRSKIFHF
jgi:hypothetical protein